MKIIVVGAAGTIGRAVVEELGARHDIVRVGRSAGDVKADITDPASIAALYAKVDRFDAVVSAAGRVHFGPFMEMGEDEYMVGLRGKLMGQVNLVLLGRERISDGGSFTLTTGILTHDPIVRGSGASIANGAIEAFAQAAAIEMPRGLRINVVSPGVIEESMEAIGHLFRGHEPVPAARAALAYSRSIEGAQTGRIYEVI